MSAPEENPTRYMDEPVEPVADTTGPRLKLAFVLALAADALQLAVIPLFVEGAESPLADAVDIVMAGVLYFLLGWHWEFLPSFLGKLVPGVDLVPLWTLAVGNVYRKNRAAFAQPGSAQVR